MSQCVILIQQKKRAKHMQEVDLWINRELDTSVNRSGDLLLDKRRNRERDLDVVIEKYI